MINKKLSALSVAALGAASLASVAAPAHATPTQVPGCGEQPTASNLQLNHSGSLCFLLATDAGAYSWTVPAGVTHLSALLVGGGSGAYFDATNGYTGTGGAVNYVDTTVAAGDTVAGAIGTAGSAGDATHVTGNGGDTSLSINSGTATTALGGVYGNGGSNICTVDYPSVNPTQVIYLGTGNSGAGTPSTACIDGTSNGIVIGLDPNAPAVFQGLPAAPVGNAGIIFQNTSTTMYAPGDGGSLLLSADNQFLTGKTSYSTSNAGDGERGIVFLVYPAVTAPLSYDANGATGGSVPTDANTYYTYDDATVLDNTGSLTRTGYTFNGWNTAADGTGTAYAANALVNLGAEGVTLYAQWTPAQMAQNPVTKKITTFKGDSSMLVPGMRTQVKKFLTSVPHGGAIVCTGSTSGAKVTGFDKKLAKTRALTVCEYAKKLRSDISYTVHINPSSGKGVSARHVWMSYTPNVG
ncbi:MAG: InlB B-repeat-containing protein [Micrococcales bacterium]